MTLTEYCTGIADAIRTKEGSTAKIPASEHKARILAISSGTAKEYDTCRVTINASNIPNQWGVFYVHLNSAGEPENWAVRFAKNVTSGTIDAVKGSNIYIWTPGMRSTWKILPAEAGKNMALNDDPLAGAGFSFEIYETAPATATITVEWD